MGLSGGELLRGRGGRKGRQDRPRGTPRALQDPPGSDLKMILSVLISWVPGDHWRPQDNLRILSNASEAPQISEKRLLSRPNTYRTKSTWTVVGRHLNVHMSKLKRNYAGARHALHIQVAIFQKNIPRILGKTLSLQNCWKDYEDVNLEFISVMIIENFVNLVNLNFAKTVWEQNETWTLNYDLRSY